MLGHFPAAYFILWAEIKFAFARSFSVCRLDFNYADPLLKWQEHAKQWQLCSSRKTRKRKWRRDRNNSHTAHDWNCVRKRLTKLVIFGNTKPLSTKIIRIAMQGTSALLIYMNKPLFYGRIWQRTVRKNSWTMFKMYDNDIIMKRRQCLKLPVSMRTSFPSNQSNFNLFFLALVCPIHSFIS